MPAGRGARTLGALAVLAIALPVVAAPKKPPPKKPPRPSVDAGVPLAPSAPPAVEPKVPEPAPPAPPAPPPSPSETEAPRAPPPPAPPPAVVELGVCPDDVNLLATPESLPGLLRQDCRSLHAEESSVAVSDSGVVVAICVRGSAAVPPKECDLHASLATEHGALGTALALGADGDLAISLKGSRIAREYAPRNGTPLTLTVTSVLVPPLVTTVRARILWRKAVQPYGRGAYVWFPLPMVTTDLSQSRSGYRLGVTPLALALGTRFFPSAASRGYFGVSLFGAWNVLVPNDTRTLSDTTEVRINFKAVGGGLLLDAAGFLAVGVGVGHTFTSDQRTDARLWLYFGPRLLGFFNDY